MAGLPESTSHSCGSAVRWMVHEPLFVDTLTCAVCISIELSNSKRQEAGQGPEKEAIVYQ